MNNNKLNVLFLAPFCDGNDVGESFNSHRWAHRLSEHVNLTVLSLHRKNQRPLSEQLPNAKTVVWKEPYYPDSLERFNSMLKPGYIKYYFAARRWIKNSLKAGQRYDVIHQMTPAAMRYPSPGAGLGIPNIHGPMQGSLDTPEGLREECDQNSPWFMKLRNVDKWRLQNDPLLRYSYRNTDLLLAGAEYARGLLMLANPKRVEIMVHLNIDGVIEHPERSSPQERGTLKLLHVGRIVRTKGLKEAIAAMSLAKSELQLTLDVIGEGPELENCRQFAEDLGVSNLITFHGKLARKEVEKFYASHDVLLFPSFREPAGGVVLEAMRHGLPVITTTVGGPGFYVTPNCGYTVAVHSHEQMSRDIAHCIEEVSSGPEVYLSKQQGAFDRVKEIGNFEKKLSWLLSEYKMMAN